ncbi:MAG: hypothetical protein RIQ41_514 [Candidatus Parcubacteria bacterium]|jgi:hypothetical protein
MRISDKSFLVATRKVRRPLLGILIAIKIYLRLSNLTRKARRCFTRLRRIKKAAYADSFLNRRCLLDKVRMYFADNPDDQ